MSITSSYDVRDLDGCRAFYYERLKPFYDNLLPSEERAAILSSISRDELERLYHFTSSAGIASGMRKKDILDFIRYYFSDEERSQSLARGMALFG